MLDVVRNSLQPLYVTNATVRAGVAAEAGEENRIFAIETKILLVVVSLPFVVKTLGLWSSLFNVDLKSKSYCF